MKKKNLTTEQAWERLSPFLTDGPQTVDQLQQRSGMWRMYVDGAVKWARKRKLLIDLIMLEKLSNCTLATPVYIRKRPFPEQIDLRK